MFDGSLWEFWNFVHEYIFRSFTEESEVIRKPVLIAVVIIPDNSLRNLI